jgi:hypothetical protein
MILGLVALFFFGVASRKYNETKRYTAGFWFFLILSILVGFASIGAGGRDGDCDDYYYHASEVRSRM